jgi:hypothetical protein
MSRRLVKVVLISSASFCSAPSLVSAADLCASTKFKCSGFEPNWQFVTTTDATGNHVVEFTDPENPDWESQPLVASGCAMQGSPNDFEVITEAPLSLTANIVGQSCVEPDDEKTDFSVTVTFTQGALSDHPAQVSGTGCCTILP